MTGGYGCIGAWVAKQLVEAGREVWIYDLKEDTHRIDLLLDKDQRARVHFLEGEQLRRIARIHAGQGSLVHHGELALAQGTENLVGTSM